MLRLRPVKPVELLCSLGTAWVVVQVALVHRWFARPFAVWIGLDDAYVAAAGRRLIDGHWVPYVDAVSHRGPLLYWVSGLLQLFGGSDPWLPIRTGALLFAEAAVVLIFATGALAKRPLAGFIGAAAFAFATTFAMPPHDGIGLNGELVAVPFSLAAMLATVAGVRSSTPPERRVWLAALAGLLATVGGLGKQPAMAHLIPIALWWAGDALRRRQGGASDWRPVVALGVGAITPWLAVLSFYLRTGHVRALLYYLFTYNRKVYFAPVTASYAIESTYAFCREHAEFVLILAVASAWAAARLWSEVRSPRSVRSWLVAWAESGLVSTVALHALLAFWSGAATFRYFEHYFVTALPWMGLWFGLTVDDAFTSLRARKGWATGLVVTVLCSSMAVLGKVHVYWLEGQRRTGVFGNPMDEPVTNYVKTTTRPQDTIFAWGFAPEYYVSTGRKAASRFVYTTFVAGLVPWFDSLTLEQENALAVPGARELLLRELDASKPELVLDVPSSMRGRSMRRYDQLAAWLERGYCYETTIVGRNSHVASVYRRKRGECANPMPLR